VPPELHGVAGAGNRIASHQPGSSEAENRLCYHHFANKMATCPHCMGALTENHRCPRSVRVSRLGETIATLVIGASVGGIFVFAIEDRPGLPFFISAALLGAVLANALRRAVGGPKF
jgi:hypothetical protein